MKISIVIPVYNESAGIDHFHRKLLMPAIDKLDTTNTEIIYVNDGSSDDTIKKLQSIASDNPKVKILSFTRNFGKEIALTAGLAASTGDAIITIDADGQQPPDIIPEFIAKWQSGSLVVTGVRKHYQKHGVIAKLGSKLFYFLMNSMGSKTIPGSTDYRLIDKEVRDEFIKLTEHSRITRGLVDWMGYDQTYIYYVYGNRYAGKPSYNFKKLTKLAIDSFISLSIKPLLIFGWIGLAITFLSGILGVFVIIEEFIMKDPLGLKWTGPTCLAIFITFLIGLVLISQSIIALYISHIHTEALDRPLYIIDKKNSRNLR